MRRFRARSPTARGTPRMTTQSTSMGWLGTNADQYSPLSLSCVQPVTSLRDVSMETPGARRNVSSPLGPRPDTVLPTTDEPVALPRTETAWPVDRSTTLPVTATAASRILIPVSPPLTRFAETAADPPVTLMPRRCTPVTTVFSTVVGAGNYSAGGRDPDVSAGQFGEDVEGA